MNVLLSIIVPKIRTNLSQDYLEALQKVGVQTGFFGVFFFFFP